MRIFGKVSVSSLFRQRKVRNVFTVGFVSKYPTETKSCVPPQDTICDDKFIFLVCDSIYFVFIFNTESNLEA